MTFVKHVNPNQPGGGGGGLLQPPLDILRKSARIGLAARFHEFFPLISFRAYFETKLPKKTGGGGGGHDGNEALI